MWHFSFPKLPTVLTPHRVNSSRSDNRQVQIRWLATSTSWALLLLIILWSASSTLATNQLGAVDPTFPDGVGPNQAVRAVELQADGKIIIGGEFTTYNNVSRGRVARLNSDGSLDTTFNPGSGANRSVFAIKLQNDGKIIIGGEFSSYNGVESYGIARLNSDGSLDTTFTSYYGKYLTVYAIKLQSDGKILIGGKFGRYRQTPIHKVARLNSDGSQDDTFNLEAGGSSDVMALELQSDGKIIIGGWFTIYHHVSRGRVARLNTDGSLDTSFNPGSGADSAVYGIKLQSDGKIIIGGWFTTYNGTSRNRIARLNTDGSLDTSFNPGSGANENIFAVELQADGKILIGGKFTTYNNVSRGGIARLNSDGSLDTTFNLGVGANGSVEAVGLQSDGKIIIGGRFTSVDTYMRTYIARLEGEGEVVCNPLAVTSITDDGQASSCGTFSYALNSANSGTTITFALSSGNTITFTNSLTPTLKAGVTVDGGDNGIILNGNGVAGDGVQLGGNNTLINLTIKSFSGRELVSSVYNTTANRLDHIRVQS